MKITTQKVLQSAWIAGAVAWFGTEIYDMISTVKAEKKERIKIQLETDARMNAFHHAQDFMVEEINAGHYDGAGFDTLMKDFKDLVNLQVPNTYK